MFWSNELSKSFHLKTIKLKETSLASKISLFVYRYKTSQRKMSLMIKTPFKQKEKKDKITDANKKREMQLTTE